METHKFFEVFETAEDWEDAGLSDVTLISDEGQVADIYTATIWRDKYVLKLYKVDNYDAISEREAKVGYLIKSVESLHRNFIKTIGHIKSNVLPTNFALVKYFNFYNIVVLEHIKSDTNLQQWLEKFYADDVVDKEIIRGILFQITYALSIANAEIGFQHNDIKMDNIMVSTTLNYEDTKRYAIGTDSYTIKFVKGTPMIKLIDYNASVVRLPNQDTPLDGTQLYSYPLALDILLARIDNDTNALSDRKNDADMTGIFNIAMSLIAHNKWYESYGEKWGYSVGGILDYETDNNTMILINYKKYFPDIDEHLLTSFVRSIQMRDALHMENSYAEKLPGYDKFDNMYSNNLVKIVDEDEYRLMFMQRLFGASSKERQEFGVMDSNFTFANAMYHPYFALHYKLQLGVNPRGGDIISPDSAAPLEYSENMVNVDNVNEMITQFNENIIKINIKQEKVKNIKELKKEVKRVKEEVEEEEGIVIEEETKLEEIKEEKKEIAKLEDEIEEEEEEVKEEEEEEKKYIQTIVEPCLEKFLELSEYLKAYQVDDVSDLLITYQDGEFKGCLPDIISTINVENVAISQQIKKYSGIKYFFNVKSDDGIELSSTSDEIFKENGKSIPWKIQRIAVLYAIFAGTYLRLLDNLISTEKYNSYLGLARRLSLIEDETNWIKKFQPTKLNIFRQDVNLPELDIRSDDIDRLDVTVSIFNGIFESGEYTAEGNIKPPNPKIEGALEIQVLKLSEQLYDIICNDLTTERQEQFYKDIGDIDDVLYYESKEKCSNNTKFEKAREAWKKQKYLLIWIYLAEYVKFALENQMNNPEVPKYVRRLTTLPNITTASAFKTFVKQYYKG